MACIEDREEALARVSVQHLGEDPAAILRRGGVGRRGRIGCEDRLADVEVGAGEESVRAPLSTSIRARPVWYQSWAMSPMAA